MAGPLVKPRNPYAVPAAQRKAGAHERSEKAQRREAKVQLTRESRLARRQGKPKSES